MPRVACCCRPPLLKSHLLSTTASLQMRSSKQTVAATQLEPPVFYISYLSLHRWAPKSLISSSSIGTSRHPILLPSSRAHRASSPQPLAFRLELMPKPRSNDELQLNAWMQHRPMV
ncbi:uncharacterized protein HMPREF1120_06877 [Exophiala dermatitidis NIH/UT8656]|uniref:Uncharacterized protein n=1 Tax=Exophiala dermatitidis (strain ATCC 34100 / CBS 525.76 / NIH/UT8656) TaxID=858893 RepID=H6C7P5_EXODN|nr:uncharacterized protein HMPREF1120_06877 [Exophiala dermatitidis NIH/UT8656]EHY58875.1 hypothetical protein HMPREF1120_06877 [Exophiala dermatitidis NIH/UT8656]